MTHAARSSGQVGDLSWRFGAGSVICLSSNPGMPGAESVRRFHHDAPGFFRWQSLAALEARRERFTIHICHDEVDEPVGTFADGVDWNDVGMGKPGGRLRFAEEADANFFAERQLRRQDLDRDAAFQPLVPGTIHDAHAAAPDLSFESVRRAEGLTEPLR